jgi:GT2 family glycosyltransferase
VDVVVIGYNEAESIQNCLRSIAASTERPARMIFVDAGSTDGTVDRALEQDGVTVLRLRAGRANPGAARNAGLAVCTAEYVQFVDGDMTLDPRWLQTAVSYLRDNPEVTCVVGRTSEDRAKASVFDLIVSVDWETKPVGDVSAPGGGGCFRRATLAGVGGYDARIRGAEETELGERLRREGGVIRSIAEPMAIHQAGLHTVSDLFRRYYRTGESTARTTRLGMRLQTKWRVMGPATLIATALALAVLAWVLASVWPLLCLLGLATVAVGRLTMRYVSSGIGWWRATGAAVGNYVGMVPSLAGEIVECLRPNSVGDADIAQWDAVARDRADG